jgi:glycosyltransferase involved in cell wall biosynthesis
MQRPRIYKQTPAAADLDMTASDTPPAISVVTPTLNQARYIDAAVESVLSQPVPGPELVVQDGGSTDCTPAQLAALQARHPARLRWSSGADQGPADAVNRAVAQARGPIIGWLNSDALYAPGAVAGAFDDFAQHPERVLVCGEGEHIDAGGRPLGPYPTRGPDAPLAAFADGCHLSQPTACFRRDMVAEALVAARQHAFLRARRHDEAGSLEVVG